MKKINLSRWTQAMTAIAVFIAWTVTSFLCHKCGKMFLQLSERSLNLSEDDSDTARKSVVRFILALTLTVVQSTTCLLLMRLDHEQKGLVQPRAISLLISSHVLATLAANYSMAYIEAASTQAIKLTEPIIMAIAHHVVFQTAVPTQTTISIPLIICGALVFTGSTSANNLADSVGISLAFASNIILAARNITLKKVQNGSTERTAFVLKPYTHIFLTFLICSIFMTLLLYLEHRDIVPWYLLHAVGLSLMSGCFHVAYSYISTSIVLKVMNVVSHSIANIFKRFLVVLLLYALGNRQVSMTNFSGLAVAAFGLMIYTYGKLQSKVQLTEYKEEKECTTRDLPRRKMWLALIIGTLLFITMAGSLGRSKLQAIYKPLRLDSDPNVYMESHGLLDLETPNCDFSHILTAESNPEMREFLSWRLVDHPEDTDRRAKTLTSNKDIIEEAQRILVNLLQDLLGKAKHVMLIEIATYENKGDPAITVGEVLLLRRMNISIVFYCDTSTCTKNYSLQEAIKINQKYAKDELVILMQGGGNVVGYSSVDSVREKILDTFPDRKCILFSQSIWLHSKNSESLEYAKKIYSNRTNLTMFMRDRQSLEIAKVNFKNVNLILAPDMAFCIGMVPRQMPPAYDIIWLRRDDDESSKYALPTFPLDITVAVSDWLANYWISNRGTTDMENSFLIAASGFQFLQRGRIVVTDRLHGHILSTLMNIPHVIIDNPPHHKLSSFDRSWTQKLSNTIIVSNGTLALKAAMTLLKRYHNSLPSVGPRDMFVAAKKPDKE